MPDLAASHKQAGWAGDIVTLFVAVMIPALGVNLFFKGSVVVTLALVVGLTVALGCTSWQRAAIIAAVGVFLAFPLAARVSMTPWPPGLLWLADALASAVASAVLAALAHVAVTRYVRLRHAIAALVVGVLVLTMWSVALGSAATPQPGGSILEKLNTAPQLTAQSFDEEIYRAFVFRLRAGEPYHPMAASVIAELNASGRAPVASHSVLSYRLPTLYRFLASLPPTAGWFLGAMFVICSAGVVAGYLLARQFVFEPLALLGATLLSATFAGYAGQLILDTEPWAGILALVSVALVVAARRDERYALQLHIAAALAAFAAASIRELAVAFLVVGLAAALVDRTGPRRRAWIPWTAAWVATIAVYIAHWAAARAAYASIPTTAGIPTNGFPWFHPDASGLIAGVALFGRLGWLAVWMAWAVVLLGVAGSLLAARDLPSRVMLAGVAALGPATLLFLRPAGFAVHGAPSYWAYLVLPTTIACAPLVFAWLVPEIKRPEPAE